MKSFENRNEHSEQRRSHPWSTGAGDVSHRYYDFKVAPELIPVVLEDFRPWGAHAAIRSLYGLLVWINGPASPFESNDCAFDGPEENADRAFDKRLQCGGRLGVLFRDLRLNTSEQAIGLWVERIHDRLRALEPDFAWGAVGTTRQRVDYLELPGGRADGWQLLISFWAWGDDEAEVFENLGRVIAVLRYALESSAG